MSRLRIVSVLIRVLGAMVVLVALLHLYSTKLIIVHVLSKITDVKLRAFIAPGYVLDHVVVGILLLPIGLNMWSSAKGVGKGQRWAWTSNLTFCIAILTTPVWIMLLMSFREMSSPLFLMASILMAFIGIVGTTLLWWVRNEFKPDAT